MPASHPALTIAQNQASGAATPTPSAFVIYDPISGPKGSPLDVRTISYAPGANSPTYTNAAATQTPSTGAMSTGIGIGENDIIAQFTGINPATNPQAIFKAGFNDNDQPGTVPTYSAGGPPPNVSASTVNSTRLYIGGGKCTANVNGVAPPVPYSAGIVILGSGNGGSRDAGAGPAFQGFGMKMVTAAGAVAIGAVIETGFVNRSNRSLVTGESIFGSASAASGAVA